MPSSFTKSFLFFTGVSLFFISGAFSQCTEEKDAEMAKYMNLTKTRDAQGCSQCGMLALYFCSARYTVKAEDKLQVAKLIDACKENIRQMGEPYCCPDYLNKQPEWGTAAATSGAGSQSNAANGKLQPIAGTTAMINTISDVNTAALGSEKAAAKLFNNSILSSGLKTKDEIDAAYSSQLQAIKQSAGELKQSEDAKTKSVLDTGITGISDNGVLSGIGLAAGYIHKLEAEAAQKKAIEMLAFQKTLAYERLEMDKKQQQLDKRLSQGNEKPGIVGTGKMDNFNLLGHRPGISLDEAKKQYRDFFKKAKKPVESPHGAMITSKLKNQQPGQPQAFYVSNNTVTGIKVLIGSFLMDMNFKSGFDTTASKIAELEALFGTKPAISVEEDPEWGKATKRYSWASDTKTVELEFIQSNLMMFQNSEVTLGIYQK